VEDFTTILGRLDDYAGLLEVIGGSGGGGDLRPGRWWRREDLEEALDRWSHETTSRSTIVAPYERIGLLQPPQKLEPIAAFIGAADAADLLIAKALESGTLEEARGEEGRRYAWRRPSVSVTAEAP
jgi:hypothetical protein